MTSNTAILVYNRKLKLFESEKVPGRKWMELLYANSIGRRVTCLLLSRRSVSRFYGWLQVRAFSHRQIIPFVESYDIDLKEAVMPAGGFRSFNDFFIRHLKPGARPVNRSPDRFVSPADSRLLVLEITRNFSHQVKGFQMTLPELLGGADIGNNYQGGLCLCFRLAPSDYHRFGYVEDGEQGPVHSQPGMYHSVNPLALRHKPDVLALNFRQWCHIKTKNWGTLIQIEIGAMMVGSIIQHNCSGGPVRRGEEKGYFQFGGSTVLVIVKPDRVIIDEDIMRHSAKGIETRVRYGEAIGKRSDFQK
ncbi:MAG: phosphatidylserine decarboxylase [Desulfobacteraceae bacterium]|nr:phosphatidylserine decarboxylase [Desulfobacteraceae bacterium]